MQGSTNVVLKGRDEICLNPPNTELDSLKNYRLSDGTLNYVLHGNLGQVFNLTAELLLQQPKEGTTQKNEGFKLSVQEGIEKLKLVVEAALQYKSLPDRYTQAILISLQDLIILSDNEHKKALLIYLSKCPSANNPLLAQEINTRIARLQPVRPRFTDKIARAVNAVRAKVTEFFSFFQSAKAAPVSNNSGNHKVAALAKPSELSLTSDSSSETTVTKSIETVLVPASPPKLPKDRSYYGCYPFYSASKSDSRTESDSTLVLT